MEHVADEVLSSGNFSLCEPFSSPTGAFGDKKELQEPGKEKWPNLQNRRIVFAWLKLVNILNSEKIKKHLDFRYFR